MKKKHSKIIASATAVVLVAATALAGTLAWQSISQNALNELEGTVNPGGRLHDDFNGSDKDIYVENFTAVADGGVPIYARVRLREYMETGDDAGRNTDSPDRSAASLVEGAVISDRSTWTVHKLDTADNKIQEEYWNWELGGSTIFMPTFNKNKDSLAADINGTFAGPDGNPITDADRYQDHYYYTMNETVNGQAIYDADSDNVDEGEEAVEGEDITIVDEQHRAKSTLNGTVISMAQWKSEGAQPGDYWVYDVDGWAYWANPIRPGEATGLLLNSIEMKEKPQASWYYAINAEGQFATAGDWGNEIQGTGFYEDGITEDAVALLNQVADITVRGNNGKIYVSYADGTYREMAENISTGVGVMGDYFVPGLDGMIGTEDDIRVTVLKPADPTYGSKFIPNEDGSYFAAGPDGGLGTEDDIRVWGMPTLQDGITEEGITEEITEEENTEEVQNP